MKEEMQPVDTSEQDKAAEEAATQAEQDAEIGRQAVAAKCVPALCCTYASVTDRCREASLEQIKQQRSECSARIKAAEGEHRANT